MKGQIEKVYSKQCRYCSSEEKPVQIFWDDIHKQFTDKDGQRHSCPSSSKQSQDHRLNEMINDIKSTIEFKFSKVEERFDSLQRTEIHMQSMLTEIRLKLNEALS